MPALELHATTVAEHVEHIRTRGYTVIEGILGPEQVAIAAAALDKILDYERRHGDRVLWDNPWYQISHLLVGKDKIFRELCLTPKLLVLARLVVGQDCTIGSVNGYTARPDGIAQELHPDRIVRSAFVDSMQTILTLDEFTRENGCTRVVPYSQDREIPEGVDKCWGCAELASQTIDLEVPAGSLIAYNSSLVHSSGANRTLRRRRCIHISFLRSWIQPEWDFSLSLPKNVKADLTKEELALYGFNAHPLRYNFQTCSEKEQGQRGLRYLRRLKSKLLAR